MPPPQTQEQQILIKNPKKVRQAVRIKFFAEYEAAKSDLEKVKSKIVGQNDCINDLRDSL